MLKDTEGLRRETPSVFSAFSFSEKLVSVEVEDVWFGVGNQHRPDDISAKGIEVYPSATVFK